MSNSIQFNDQLFLFIGVTLALTFIVYGIILTQKRPPSAEQKHWLAYRRLPSSVCAEQQAEQIIRSCWPGSVK